VEGSVIGEVCSERQWKETATNKNRMVHRQVRGQPKQENHAVNYVCSVEIQ